MMWVDTDGCVSAAQYCKYFITSVEKGIQTAVKTAVLSAANGTFKGGTYVGTLANGGVAPRPVPRLRYQGPSLACRPRSPQRRLPSSAGKIVPGAPRARSNRQPAGAGPRWRPGPS